MFSTALSKKRVVGLLLLTVIVSLFFAFNRFPKLDAVRGDLDAVTAPEVQCFQGFCIEREPGSTFLSEWWGFSVTYLRLVTVGMMFAFAVAGLTEAFLFPPGSGRGFSSGSVFKRTVKGFAVGPVMNLCSACIVPVATAFRRRGAGIEGAIAMVQGSATMNVPALAMVFFVFTPLLGVSRLVLAIIGALLIGPLVLMAVRKGSRNSPGELEAAEYCEEQESSAWRPVLAKGFREWAKRSIRYLLRMGPIMIVAGFASGLAIQWISPETVSTYLGNNAQGVVIAAIFGILINVPLLFEIPLVVLLLLLGMGTAPAATLLFTAAAGGPMTFWGLAKVMPRRAIAVFAAATWALGVAGGLSVLGIGALIWDDGTALRIKTTAAAAPVEIDGERLRDVQQLFTSMGAGTGLSFQHFRDSSLFNLGGGTAAGDYNNDGHLDIYAVNSRGANALYRNNGDGTFTDLADPAGVAGPQLSGNGAGWADYDNDGDLDLFVAAWGASKLFRNNGPPSFAFTDVTSDAGVGDPDSTYRTMGVAWGDYDSDGYLDLLVVRHLGEYHLETPKSMDFTDVPRPVALYHNNGDGTFTDRTTLLSSIYEVPSNVVVAGFKPGFVDYDNDGDADIYLVNDFGSQLYPNVLWRNDGPDDTGTWIFADVSTVSGTDLEIFGMGLAIGDYDNDGDLDFYMTNMGPNQLLRNEGDGTFTNQTDLVGVGRGKVPGLPGYDINVGWGTGFFDLDNDGFLDLYAASGYVDMDPFPNPRLQPNALFINNGNGTFNDVSLMSGADDPGIARGIALADFNGDGCVDIFVVNLGDKRGTAGVSRALWNNCDHGNNWLEIKTVGTASNRDGIGARIKVTAGGMTQIREMGCSQSHVSHSVIPAHFGLGQATRVETVEIRWPSGSVQMLADVTANQQITVIEP